MNSYIVEINVPIEFVIDADNEQHAIIKADALLKPLTGLRVQRDFDVSIKIKKPTELYKVTENEVPF